MKSFSLAQSAAINCRQAKLRFDGEPMEVCISMARVMKFAERALCGGASYGYGYVSDCRPSKATRLARRHRYLPTFLPCCLPVLFLPQVAPFSVRHSRFALLNFRLLAGRFCASISLTMCVFIAYFFWLLLLFLLLFPSPFPLPLHIYAFVCKAAAWQQTHQRNCNSLGSGIELCTICICMHFAWQPKDGKTQDLVLVLVLVLGLQPETVLAPTNVRHLHGKSLFWRTRFRRRNSVCNATIVLHINGFRVRI